MPTAVDLVTDLPADFEVFGQAVATSMADLLGGTSGQILAKNSNTDMDFVWIANDQGDITGITASSPLTGGGTSGAVTIGILNGTTSNLGAVQLSDSISSTSTTLAATANAVKTSYDLANAAIPKSLIDAAGDLIVGTAADTAGRLAIGTANQVLKVNSGATALEWGTAAGGGAVVQIADTTLGSAAADITFSSIPSTYNHLMVIISGQCASASFNGTDLSVQINSDTGGNYRNARNTKYGGAGSTVTIEGASANKCELGNIWCGTAAAYAVGSVQMTFPNYKATTLNKTMMYFGGTVSDAPAAGSGMSIWQNTAAITTLKIFSSGGGNLNTGTRATLYGWT
jgi:hypothetical protein